MRIREIDDKEQVAIRLATEEKALDEYLGAQLQKHHAGGPAAKQDTLDMLDQLSRLHPVADFQHYLNILRIAVNAW